MRIFHVKRHFQYNYEKKKFSWKKLWLIFVFIILSVYGSGAMRESIFRRFRLACESIRVQSLMDEICWIKTIFGLPVCGNTEPCTTLRRKSTIHPYEWSERTSCVYRRYGIKFFVSPLLIENYYCMLSHWKETQKFEFNNFGSPQCLLTIRSTLYHKIISPFRRR